jgi:hypothetical protein
MAHHRQYPAARVEEYEESDSEGGAAFEPVPLRDSQRPSEYEESASDSEERAAMAQKRKRAAGRVEEYDERESHRRGVVARAEPPQQKRTRAASWNREYEESDSEGGAAFEPAPVQKRNHHALPRGGYGGSASDYKNTIARASPPAQNRRHEAPQDDEDEHEKARIAKQAKLDAIAPSQYGMQLALGSSMGGLVMGGADDIQEYTPIENTGVPDEYEFCFMCKHGSTGATRRDADKEALCEIVRKFQKFNEFVLKTMTLRIAAEKINHYYNDYIRLLVPGEKFWTRQMIIKHYKTHSTAESDTNSQIARTYALAIQNLSNNMVDPNTGRVVNTQLQEFNKTVKTFMDFQAELSRKNK